MTIRENHEATKEDRAYRILTMFDILYRGGGLNRAQLAKQFKISVKSVQRDIDVLREYIGDKYSLDSDSTIVYSRSRQGYYWKHLDDLLLNDQQILLLALILLESRVLNTAELEEIIDKMFRQHDTDRMALIAAIIDTKKSSYTPPKRNPAIGRLLLDICVARQQRQPLLLHFNHDGLKSSQKVIVEPLCLTLANMHFYLLARIQGRENYDYPETYRLDWISSYKILKDKTFEPTYSDRFQNSVFRNQAQFMPVGAPLNIKFRFRGDSLDTILERLPNAKVLSEDKNGAIITAEVLGNSIKSWLLSQGESIEVLEPLEFREDIVFSIQKMLANYI